MIREHVHTRNYFAMPFDFHPDKPYFSHLFKEKYFLKNH